MMKQTNWNPFDNNQAEQTYQGDSRDGFIYFLISGGLPWCGLAINHSKGCK